MNLNNQKNDEDWWASLLADEGTFAPEIKNEPVYQSKKSISTPNWEKAQELYREDVLLNLLVTGHNRGGVLVRGEEIMGFVPTSHLVELDNETNSAEREKILLGYQGKTIKLKLIECIPSENRIIFSERAAQAGAGSRRELFEILTEGAVVDGDVTNITDFGVFVDLGGVEGLIHISELSWGRVEDPRQVLNMNQKIKVQILNLSPERCRVSLSIKRLHENPWEEIHAKYQPGQIVPVKITSLVSFGAFARLEEGVEGLIHDSEIPFQKGVYVKEGAELQVKILEIDARKQRISLSLNLEDGDG